MKEVHSKTDCETIQALMSPFIDSMATPDEVELLESHLVACEPCGRQLQSFVSMRNLLARIEQPAIPADFVLDTRSKLSQARNRNYLGDLEQRMADRKSTRLNSSHRT